jgi:hypothetical protein
VLTYTLLIVNRANASLVACVTSARNSSRSRTTASYDVTVAAPQKNDAPLSKSKSKVTPRISCGSGVSADSDSQSDAEMQPTIDGLPSDEDDSLERAWALSCGLTAMEAQKLVQVIKFFFVPFFR